MDSIRIKIKQSIPKKNQFFNERIHTKIINLKYIQGNRFVYTNNTWRKRQINNGIYVPKYWIEEDYIKPNKKYLYLEFSIPKLLFGENISEIRERHKEKIFLKIQDFTEQIGIKKFLQQIRNSKVTMMAFAKNINITDLCSCSTAIKALAPFNDRFCSDQREIHRNKRGGMSIYFNNKNSTFKLYDKLEEVISNAKTNKEIQIKNAKLSGNYVNEILRVELTLKNGQAVYNRTKKILNGKKSSFENLINEKINYQLLRNEINKIYNHPLKNFIFLAQKNSPYINAYINKHFKDIRIKNAIFGIVAILQNRGLRQARLDYMRSYKSRQTWYNHLKKFESLPEQIDHKTLDNIEAIKIHSKLLQEFNINTQKQIKMF